MGRPIVTPADLLHDAEVLRRRAERSKDEVKAAQLLRSAQSIVDQAKSLMNGYTKTSRPCRDCGRYFTISRCTIATYSIRRQPLPTRCSSCRAEHRTKHAELDRQAAARRQQGAKLAPCSASETPWR